MKRIFIHFYDFHLFPNQIFLWLKQIDQNRPFSKVFHLFRSHEKEKELKVTQPTPLGVENCQIIDWFVYIPTRNRTTVHASRRTFPRVFHEVFASFPAVSQQNLVRRKKNLGVRKYPRSKGALTGCDGTCCWGGSTDEEMILLGEAIMFSQVSLFFLCFR